MAVHLQRPTQKNVATDVAGAFEIADAGTGSVEIYFSRDGYGIKWVRDLTLVAGTPLVLDEKLTPAATLHLRVKDGKGRPVVGKLFLGIRPTDANSGGTSVGTSVTADDAGVATYRQIVPGSYKLRVAPGDGSPAQVEAEIQAGENTVDVQFP